MLCKLQPAVRDRIAALGRLLRRPPTARAFSPVAEALLDLRFAHPPALWRGEASPLHSQRSADLQTTETNVPESARARSYSSSQKVITQKKATPCFLVELQP